jgi:hypothetical protein
VVRNIVIFRWQAQLGPLQFYIVRLRHPESGWARESGALIGNCWDTTLPGNQFGEWRWRVLIVEGNRVVAQSEERHFWLDPFSHDPLPTPRPCGVPGDFGR